MLGHVTTITHKNNLVLSNIDPGGGTSTRKVKIGNLPNIFYDDCSFKLRILTHVNSVGQNDSQSELDSLLIEESSCYGIDIYVKAVEMVNELSRLVSA